MRPLPIEDFGELVEASRLLEEVGGSWFGGFFLEREMHAFMAAVLLRVTWLDALNADAQAQPPDVEFAQVKHSVSRSKRHTVIAADVGRQFMFLEKPFKHDESVVFSSRRQGFTGEQEAAGVIGDGERITVVAIAEQEFAFVIGAPEIVGCRPGDKSVPCALRRTRPRRSTGL